MNEAIFQLEQLTVKMDGMASMIRAIRDGIFDGTNAPEAYYDAVHLMSELMGDFDVEFNDAVKALRKGKKAAL